MSESETPGATPNGGNQEAEAITFAEFLESIPPGQQVEITDLFTVGRTTAGALAQDDEEPRGCRGATRGGGGAPFSYSFALPRRTSEGAEDRVKFKEAHMSEDERAIRELVAAWMEASRAGDLDTVLGLMADDAVFMVPGREPFGKEEFAAMSRGMKDVRIGGMSDIRELRVLGDWAYIRNHIEVTMTPPGGTPVRRATGR
jgi:uncharacterized protein (TIGR02246 family)